MQLKPRAAFDQATLDADVEAVRAAYRNIGRSDATVTGRTMDLGEGRVNVVFEINEGDRTKIAKINFVGNQAFGNRRLSDVISTKRSNPLSWLTRNDVYSEDRLARRRRSAAPVLLQPRLCGFPRRLVDG